MFVVNEMSNTEELLKVLPLLYAWKEKDVRDTSCWIEMNEMWNENGFLKGLLSKLEKVRNEDESGNGLLDVIVIELIEKFTIFGIF